MSIIVGDCIEAMEALPEASIDAVVSDPPYGLEFMGAAWDAPWKRGTANQRQRREAERADPIKAKYLDHSVEYDRRPARLKAWHLSWLREAFRILKPGGHILAMSGTRTYHHIASAAEDAGFEIRDMLAWMYGSGFPKSHNLGGEREGYGTALKPAHEPILLARKPLIGTVAANVEKHGTGALNIDGCRIEGVPPSVPQPAGGSGNIYGFKNGAGRSGEMSHATGRWPANVILDPEAAAMLDEQSGMSTSAGGENSGRKGTRDAVGGFGYDRTPINRPTDVGGASRFLYTAKPSQHERSAGTDDRNSHPTVKPIALMRWLARLITPPGATLLDPFLGSGTTAIAANLEGFRWIGIERDPAYADIARKRIAWWRANGERGFDIRPEEKRDEQMDLFQ